LIGHGVVYIQAAAQARFSHGRRLQKSQKLSSHRRPNLINVSAR
jgi:hypothetical protein